MRCEGNTTTTQRPATRESEPRTSLAILRPGRVLVPEGDGSRASPPTSLTQAVRAAVRATEESALRPVARPDAGLAYEPRTLLTLLSYCYARDIFASTDVEDILRRDAIFRQLCDNEFPGAQLIRRFRRDNREALQRCLAGVLRAVARPSAPPGNERNETDLDEEAARRIMKAVFIDSMASDD